MSTLMHLAATPQLNRQAPRRARPVIPTKSQRRIIPELIDRSPHCLPELKKRSDFAVRDAGYDQN